MVFPYPTFAQAKILEYLGIKEIHHYRAGTVRCREPMILVAQLSRIRKE